MTAVKYLLVIILLLVEHGVLATTKIKERQNGRQMNFGARSWDPELELAGSNWISNFVEPETTVTEQENEEEKIIKEHSRAPKSDLLGIFNTDEIRKYAFQYGKHLLQQLVNADYSKFLYSPITGDKEPSNEKEGTGRTTAAKGNIQ
ncbi:unnamed protein product [Allacma fusca]|uniref:Uncharacterized protein n=1 Tax=Allacma fusca TaxID=39272 RepID=A0A8J2PF60_9HEXA|nr:unnamed protein product [Allacma fusca]